MIIYKATKKVAWLKRKEINKIKKIMKNPARPPFASIYDKENDLNQCLVDFGNVVFGKGIL